ATRHAAEQLVLPTLAKPAEIGVNTIRRGDAGIVFLDPPAHLLHQRLLQACGVAKQALGVVVFSFEIFPDVGVQDRGIAQPLLPVRIPDPCIVVGHRYAVGGEGMRAPRRDRRGLWACSLGRLGHSILVWSCGRVISSPLYRVARCRIPEALPWRRSHRVVDGSVVWLGFSAPPGKA